MTVRRALALFISLSVVLVAQAGWWIYFMARLTDEKVELAAQLGADSEFVERLHQQEISRQVMLGSEGLFFLVLIGLGVWLIYRALVRTEELKFHQQNFLMAVTHELKTPIASMNIYADCLQSEKISSQQKEQIIPRMKQDIDRLERLVENVLEASRFERSGYSMQPHRFDLSSVVTAAVDQIEASPLNKELHVERAIQPSVFIRGDAPGLRRTIDAVLENALKYNESAKVVLNVCLTRASDKVMLSIADNGIGLSKKDCIKVFNRFYRVGDELHRTASGSGLGLYLCSEIIAAHDGTIMAVSEGLQKGTTFTIYLKAEEANEDHTAC
ncbi:MAG: sensor histidine kinase [Candidatus Zixiibacteriota bacterium]